MESEDNKVYSVNTNDSVCCRRRFRLQMVGRRLGGRRWHVKNLIKFLLFMEDQPKHKVWDNFNALHMAVVLPLSIIPYAVFIVAGYALFGVVGFFVAYVAGSVLAIEIPHCIFDR